MSEQETPQAVISNLLHENTANIPENDYLRMQDALMQINNNQRGQNNDSSNDSSNENERTVDNGYGATIIIPPNAQGELPLFVTIGRFLVCCPINLYQLLPRQIPYCIASYLIKKMNNRNDRGFKYADFEFCDECESEELINLDSMRESIIPHLQKLGFDVHLYLNEEWDRTLCIAWEENVIPYTLSNDNIEQFSKTTDQYYQFEGDEEEEVDDEEEEQEEESDDGEEREVIL